jgi:glycosyltransferase involved in cell wall biosynthesis
MISTLAGAAGRQGEVQGGGGEMQWRPSVIIPARNAGATLGACLTALAASDGDVVLHEMIVVDDGSTDDTAAVAAAAGVRVLAGPARVPAAARNAGVRVASGDPIVFIDADCAPEPGCLAALLAPFADASVAGVRGSYTTRQRAIVARFVQLEMDEKQARMAASPSVAVMDTACVAYRRAVFLTSGGFDERFPHAAVEDTDLSFRIAARG